MADRIFPYVTQEERNFAFGVGIAIAKEDELPTRVARMSLDAPEIIKTQLKKIMVVYNVLKKFWDENDNDGYIKFLRLFLKSHRFELVGICAISTLGVDLFASMENAETIEQSEQHYLETVNHLKFMYDLRKEAGIPTDV